MASRLGVHPAVPPDSVAHPIIRVAIPADAAALAALGSATFTETFGHLYAQQDLQAFISATHSLDAWAHALADAQRAVWLATLGDGTAVGFVAAGPCKLPVEQREATAGEIHQLYVSGRQQNLGIGSRLLKGALEWLERQGSSPLYIGVWSENLGAQRFYQRHGFAKVGEYGFPVGATIDREFILRR